MTQLLQFFENHDICPFCSAQNNRILSFSGSLHRDYVSINGENEFLIHRPVPKHRIKPNLPAQIELDKFLVKGYPWMKTRNNLLCSYRTAQSHCPNKCMTSWSFPLRFNGKTLEVKHDSYRVSLKGLEISHYSNSDKMFFRIDGKQHSIPAVELTSFPLHNVPKLKDLIRKLSLLNNEK